jgi:hypothetical protein
MPYTRIIRKVFFCKFSSEFESSLGYFRNNLVTEACNGYVDPHYEYVGEVAAAARRLQTEIYFSSVPYCHKNFGFV